MTRDIPPEVIQAAARQLRAVFGYGEDHCRAIAEEVLFAAEQAWPHNPPARDLASTTAAVTERAARPVVLGYRARPTAFGFTLDVEA